MISNSQIEREADGLVELITRMVLSKVRHELSIHRVNLANAIGPLPPGTGAPPVHTHPPDSITDLKEYIHDVVDGLIVAGYGILKEYDDNANTLTISLINTVPPPPDTYSYITLDDDYVTYGGDYVYLPEE